MVKTLVVPELITDCKLVVVATPLIVEVSTVPEVVREFELIILVLAMDPPRLELIVLAELVSALGTVKFVTARLVVVALVAVRLVKKPVTALKRLVNKLVVVALVAVKEVVCILLALVIPVSIRLLS